MSTELFSSSVFYGIVTFLTGGIGGVWVLYDAFNLARIRNADGRDPLIRDRRFGYVVGMLVGIIGVAGCLRFYDVI